MEGRELTKQLRRKARWIRRCDEMADDSLGARSVKLVGWCRIECRQALLLEGVDERKREACIWSCR